MQGLQKFFKYYKYASYMCGLFQSIHPSVCLSLSRLVGRLVGQSVSQSVYIVKEKGPSALLISVGCT